MNFQGMFWLPSLVMIEGLEALLDNLPIFVGPHWVKGQKVHSAQQ